jgi:hypothetical protein
MTIEPTGSRYPKTAYLALLSLLFLVSGVTTLWPALSTWPAMGMFYTVSVAFLLTVSPQGMGAEPFEPRELFPVGMLILFLFVLTEIQWRPITATLFYTAGGLLVLRAILLLLTRLRTSSKALPKMIYFFVMGAAFEMMIDAYKVYLTFRPDVNPNPAKLNALNAGSPLLMAAFITYGWIFSRGLTYTLLPGLLLLAYSVVRPEFKVYGIFLFTFALGFELWLSLPRTEKKSS